MAYFGELTSYAYLPGRPAAINVGWLDAAHEFDKGAVPDAAVDELRRLAAVSPVNQTRGFHRCELCAAEPSFSPMVSWQDCTRQLGSAEVWVQSPDGVTYACPDLIVHYIDAHGYCPPAVVIDALMQMAKIATGDAR